MIPPENIPPENILERGEHAGYKFFIAHNTMGYRCGYVLIPPGHPWFEQYYENIDADVHGGLTYSDGNENGWVVGFDCAHYNDAPDLNLPNILHPITLGPGVVRSQDYVRRECQSLCEQAAAAVGFRDIIRMINARKVPAE